MRVCQVASVVSDSLRPYELQPSSVHGILHARIVGWVAISLLQGNLPKPGMEPTSPTSPALQVDALLLSHQISKDKNTGVGFYAFLQD